jgi:hypothetical protein
VRVYDAPPCIPSSKFNGIDFLPPAFAAPINARSPSSTFGLVHIRLFIDNTWSSPMNQDTYCMGAHDGQQKVRRLRGERKNLRYAVERHVHHSVRVMTWGAIAHGSRSRLFFIRGTMIPQRYTNEVLGPIVVPYVESIEEGITCKTTHAHVLLELLWFSWTRKKSNCCHDPLDPPIYRPSKTTTLKEPQKIFFGQNRFLKLYGFE